MPRIVRLTHTGPYKIPPENFPKDGKSIFICMCGLSGRLPFCDGTHKACHDEEPDKMYVYEAGTRREAEPSDAPPGAE